MENESNTKKRQDDVKKKLRIRATMKPRPKPVRPTGVKKSVSKSSPLLKSLSKARKLYAKTAAAKNSQKQKPNVVRRLILANKEDGRKKVAKRKRSVKDTSISLEDTNLVKKFKDAKDSSPSLSYRTRNAASIAYEEKIEAVRAASRGEVRKAGRGKSELKTRKEEEFIKPTFESMNESRILACGLWFRVGDIISVYGDESANYKTYYGQILVFLKDWVGEYYCKIRWLIPICLKIQQQDEQFDGIRRFNFSNYLEGPVHTDPIMLRNVNFVAHPPAGPGSLIPGLTSRYRANPCLSVYKSVNGYRILDVPTSSFTSVDPRCRNPYI